LVLSLEQNGLVKGVIIKLPNQFVELLKDGAGLESPARTVCEYEYYDERERKEKDQITLPS